MYYYSHHMRDFNSATKHLTRVERMLYRGLIELYYDTERPLVSDIERLCRRVGATEQGDNDAISYVLSEFFTLESDGYNNFRCNEEIARYHTGKSDKSRAGKASAEVRRLKKLEEEAKKSTEAQQVLNVDAADHQQNSTNQQPLTINQQPLSNKTLMPSAAANDVPNVPYEKIVAAYHEKLPSLSRVQVMTEKRKKWLKSRWRENEAMQSVDRWAAFFDYVSKSDFLMGRTGGDRVWSADFEFLVKSENFVKVSEGKYHQ